MFYSRINLLMYSTLQKMHLSRKKATAKNPKAGGQQKTGIWRWERERAAEWRTAVSELKVEMFTTRKNTLNGLQQLPESVRKGARIEDAQQDEGRSSGVSSHWNWSNFCAFAFGCVFSDFPWFNEPQLRDWWMTCRNVKCVVKRWKYSMRCILF